MMKLTLIGVVAVIATSVSAKSLNAKVDLPVCPCSSEWNACMSAEYEKYVDATECDKKCLNKLGNTPAAKCFLGKRVEYAAGRKAYRECMMERLGAHVGCSADGTAGQPPSRQFTPAPLTTTTEETKNLTQEEVNREYRSMKVIELIMPASSDGSSEIDSASPDWVALSTCRDECHSQWSSFDANIEKSFCQTFGKGPLRFEDDNLDVGDKRALLKCQEKLGCRPAYNDKYELDEAQRLCKDHKDSVVSLAFKCDCHEYYFDEYKNNCTEYLNLKAYIDGDWLKDPFKGERAFHAGYSALYNVTTGEEINMYNVTLKALEAREELNMYNVTLEALESREQ